MKLQFDKSGRHFFLSFCVKGRKPVLSRIVAKQERDGGGSHIRERAHNLLNDCGRSLCELAARIAKFGQQSGLRPEPRRAKQEDAATGDGVVGNAEGARGTHPPVDVQRRRAA